jgi:hypothetical protein
MVKFAKPKIPDALMHTMQRLTVQVERQTAKGGQWKPTPPATTTFKGAVLPLNNEDLQYLPEGSYTLNTQKLYTNGATVDVGQQFTDTYDGQTYTVITELTYGPTHPMKRYIVEKGGRAAPHAVY